MVHAARPRVVAVVLAGVIAAATGLVATGPPSWADSGTPTAGPLVSGVPLLALPRPTIPGPLPALAGTVPTRTGESIVNLLATTLTANPNTVRLRALVVAVDADDFGVPTWRSTLDHVGSGYDVVYTRTTPLEPATLVGPDGVGRYNAILLTSNSLMYPDNGGYQSAMSADEWNLLWAYERDYGIRQVSLYTSPSSWPEEYCLSGSSEGGVGDTPLITRLTAAGAGVFDYLRADALIPITQSYVYRTRVAAGCAAEPILTSGDDVLGVRTTSSDGRERLALTTTSNQYLLHTNLLAYGMFRWATRGLFLGERRHFLNADVDDWFNAADHLHPDGHIESEPGYRMSGHDVYNLYQRQNQLRAEHPSASGFAMSLAYNGGDANPLSLPLCSPNGGVETLTATSRCLAGQFRWINHTETHPELNLTNYNTNFREINDNRVVALALGLPVPISVLKTPEYSGLGVYNDDPNDDVNPPVDHGLAASNRALLSAARDLGVRYLHGNMSFASHVPSCFNCAIVHPLEPALSVVPDWPTNVAYHTTTPAEETVFYNSFYGPNGRFPYWPQDLTYEQILDYEADLALYRIASGSLYSHTFHIANANDYGGGRTLITDWLDRVLDKYDAYYRVPVLSPEWPTLGAYAQARTGHFAMTAGGTTAVYDRTAHTLTLTSPRTGTVTVSGVNTPLAQTYGTDRSAPITLIAGVTVTVPAEPRG